MKYSEMLAKLKADNARIVEIDDMAEVTEELKAEQDGLITACEDMKGKIERKKEALAVDGFVADEEANPPLEARKIAPAAIPDNKPAPKFDAKTIPATARRAISKITAFGGATQDDKELKAYRFGQFFMASLGMESAMKYCLETGMPMAVLNEGVNTAGGVLVPNEFGTDMTILLNDFGAFRPNTNVVPMTRETRTDPRQTTQMEAFWDGENETGTESDMAWDDIQLVAKKLRAFTRISNELDADSAIDVGNQVFTSIARAFAFSEDTAGFNGTGLSSTGGITGLIKSLKDAAGTPTTTSAGGIIVSANNTYAEITLAEYQAVVAILPTYADADAKWYASRLVWASSMAALANAAGGNTVANVQNGARQKEFLGYPVEIVEVMPKAAANSQVPVLFGNVAQASKLGDRMSRTISTSDSTVISGQSVWERDQLAIKGVERIDIVVHDVGDATDAGPVVGLQLFNS
jgi:HK97 family phage major capsid protein